eukprot:TRINITY_DN8354_c0_g1_i1.p1 TRINITY_DN8354_c0_g1~~TRINITY_DN8354_c0_g1_i1.p1  ORF type:complete len:198 (+),score=53.41 TRINITY_DN8354_c0_g1_i1:74-667(+)
MPLVPKADLPSGYSAVPPGAPPPSRLHCLPSGDWACVVLVDGECALCNGFVQFASVRDSRHRLRFAAQQSPVGRDLLQCFGQPQDLSTVVVIDRETGEPVCHRKSTAVMQVMRQLDGGWWLAAGLMRVIPRPIRDCCYSLVARWRITLFGRAAVNIETTRAVSERSVDPQCKSCVEKQEGGSGAPGPSPTAPRRQRL